MEEVKVSLEQGLRERLSFDLFATEEQKKDLESIKEEELKSQFRHTWHVSFCCRATSCDSPSLTEHILALKAAIEASDLTRVLKKSYPTIANKLAKTKGRYILECQFTKGDLDDYDA